MKEEKWEAAARCSSGGGSGDEETGRERRWLGPAAIDEARGRRDAAEILGEPKPEVESES